MGDARIRLSPVRVVEVVHEFPVVDWRLRVPHWGVVLFPGVSTSSMSDQN